MVKKKHWLKRPKAVPKKTKFGPRYKWFKISYLEFFFWKYYFGHTFLNLSRSSSGKQSFFNFWFSSRKPQSQQKRLHILEYSFAQKTSLILRTSTHVFPAKIFALHHFLTPKNCILEALWKQMSVYFYKVISVRFYLVGGRLNNLLKSARCLSLRKCFIFHFNWNFWTFNYFLAIRFF